MKQLTLDPTSGRMSVEEVPAPHAARGTVLVQVSHSVVSTGTELSKLDLAKKSLLDKARSRPDQVAKVISSVRTEGLAATVQKVRERLAAPMPLGYSLAGTILACGDGCDDLRVGMRVACGGTTACHAEQVVVPANLCVPVPPVVDLSDAAFATIAGIPMHGLRTGRVQLGDRVLVIGLGLLGQIATRLCVAAGAHVFGVDLRADRADLAVKSGADAAQTSLDRAVATAILHWSGGRGADVVLITAGGADNAPLVLAGDAARDRAKVVVVGAIDLEIPREPFYMKELSLVVSRSYGPGRYDPEFEEKGYAYPPGFIPWTERRNMQEFVDLLAERRITLDGLRGMTVPFEKAPDGYHALTGAEGPSPISLVLEFGAAGTTSAPSDRPRAAASARTGATPPSPAAFPPRTLRVAVVGLGNFASATLLPAIAATPGVAFARVATASPLKAEAARKRWEFKGATTTPSEAWLDAETDVVVIVTRHDTHAAFADAALRADRAVFVEKPLALTAESLAQVASTIRATRGRLMVGFNRRFAPAIAWALERLGADRGGMRFLCRVNAGPLPAEHWLLDPEIGGGRLLGEACHFIDLACHVAGSEPVEVLGRDRDAGRGMKTPQDFAIEIAFANGSMAMIEYVSSGDPSLAKERFEVHRQGTSIVIEDFRHAECYRAGKVARVKWSVKDKGHRAEIRAFLEAARTGGPTPIPEEESIRTTALTLAAARSIRDGRPLRLGEW